MQKTTALRAAVFSLFAKKPVGVVKMTPPTPGRRLNRELFTKTWCNGGATVGGGWCVLEAPTILLFFVSQDIILLDRAVYDILAFVRHVLDHITSRSALYLPGNQVLAPTARLRVCPSAAMKRGCTKLTCGAKPVQISTVLVVGRSAGW